MDFFEHQARAKSASRKLTVLFVLALLFLTVVFSSLLVMVFHQNLVAHEKIPSENIRWDLILLISSCLTLILYSVSMLRVHNLKRGGGKHIAESLGGKLIITTGDSSNGEEQRLLNIVTEMSLAAGISVPSIYILEDTSINAFAAGNAINDAVVGVTRGAIAKLDRNQLQGIVAHEFSHIVHGDMILNMRMIGILFGIMLFQKIGYQLLRSPRRRNNKNSGMVLFLGLGFLIFGSLGYFIGSLIRSAISWEREFLADASAVQFTRDPKGISEALSKAAGFSMISSPKANEVAHMFFLKAVKGFFAEPFASHPPLKERIQRIGYIDVKDFTIPQLQPTTTPKVAVASVGRLSGETLEKAHSFMAALPQIVNEALHNPERSCELVISLTISQDKVNSQKQRAILENYLSKDAIERTFFLAAQRTKGPRLAFLHLAIPVIGRLPPQGIYKLRTILQDLANSDGKVDLFEFFLLKNFEKLLANKVRTSARAKAFPNRVASPGIAIVAMMAKVGAKSAEEAQKNFEFGLRSLGMPIESAGMVTNFSFASIESDLHAVDSLKFLDKRRFLETLAVIGSANGVLDHNELDVLRGLSTYIGCPMPSVA